MDPRPDPVTAAVAVPPPRAFVQGVGVVLQGLGVLLFITNCCVCSLAGLWDPNLTSGEARQVMIERPEVIASPPSLLSDPGRAGAAITLLAATVGGLALAALGLGMQADRPRPAYGAAAVHVVLVLVLIAAGVGLWRGQASVAFRAWHLLLIAACGMALPFTLVALRQVIAQPPPPVDDTLPPGFDVRDVLAGEKPSRLKVAELRARLEVQQRELDRLERELRGGPEDDPASTGPGKRPS